MVRQGERKKNTHLSPRKSMTYAVTPPGILTSTRTSTRENALKQLHHGGTNGSTKPIRAGGRTGPSNKHYCPSSRMAKTHQKQPCFTFHVGPFVNHACDSSME